MAQSDLTIENQSFPSFRADLNNALSALNSMQSGTSRPASAVAGTMWLDTTNATIQL
jgi:UDP-N-acetylglucosamine enolpyruvyl transferase